MRTGFKLLTFIFFINIAGFLGAYTIENQSVYRITVVTKKGHPYEQDQKIEIKDVKISWLNHTGNQIALVNDFHKIALEPGQKADILLTDEKQYCDVSASYELEKTYDFISNNSLVAEYSHVGPDSKLVFSLQPTLKNIYEPK